MIFMFNKNISASLSLQHIRADPEGGGGGGGGQGFWIPP